MIQTAQLHAVEYFQMAEGGDAEPILEESMYFQIIQSFVTQYSKWKKDNDERDKYVIYDRNHPDEERFIRRSRNSQLEKMYLDHVNSFMTYYQKRSSEVLNTNKRTRQGFQKFINNIFFF